MFVMPREVEKKGLFRDLDMRCNDYQSDYRA